MVLHLMNDEYRLSCYNIHCKQYITHRLFKKDFPFPKIRKKRKSEHINKLKNIVFSVIINDR